MKRLIPLLCLLCFLACNSREQSSTRGAEAESQPAEAAARPLELNPVYHQLYEAHEKYREPTIRQQRFKQADIELQVKCVPQKATKFSVVSPMRI